MKTRADRRMQMHTAERTSALSELSAVALTHSRELADGVLPKGARGVIVHVYRDGAGYEVEFAEPLRCVVTVVREDIEPA